MLQAVGSGAIILEEKYFDKLRLIIGIQLQGYKTTKGRLTQSSSDVFKVGPDAFTYLSKLIYLNLENVVIQERELENRISSTKHFVATIIKFTRSGNFTNIVSNVLDGLGGHQENNLQSQLIFMEPDEENAAILPYNTYRMKREIEYQEEPLKTVTCIIRNGSSDALSNLFSEISSDTQVRKSKLKSTICRVHLN